MATAKPSYSRSKLSGELPFRAITLGAFVLAAALLFALFIVIFEKTLILWSAQSPLTFLLSSGWSGTVSDAGVLTAAYGAWPSIFGTLVTSLIGIAIAAPVGIFAAVYLVELAPRWVAAPLTFLVEIVAAIPSVVIGLWALGSLSPQLRDSIEWWVASTIGQVLPILSEDPRQPSSTSIFRAGIVLAIMVTPMVAAVSREVIRSVPQSLREGLVGMGATKWETIRLVVLPTARLGLFGAVLLAFGRAIGETVAVRLVIGMNNTEVPKSLFNSGTALAPQASVAFAEATVLDIGAIGALGLVLFLVSFAISATVRVLLWRSTRTLGGGR
jgi:phosphate transport system permease protein